MNQANARPRFEEILPGTYLLKVPFGPVWTGVVLITGRAAAEGGRVTVCGSPRAAAAPTVLIDSSHLEPEDYLIPALADLALAVSDIDWLLNTHVHGDHIGGHHALVAKYGLKCACLASCADALRDPAKVAIRVRTRFPAHSPAPQVYLKGVEPSLLLQEGELLAGRFYAIATPGHDDDCVTWIDTVTHTGFTGDSLQGNGTPTQGIGFYRDLAAYRTTLARLRGAGGLENLVCGHDYDGIGSVILGAENVARALRYSEACVETYGRTLAEYVGGAAAARGEPQTEACRLAAAAARGEPQTEACRLAAAAARGGPQTEAGEEEIADLARRLIGDVGCGMPASLFLAMHTVEQHLEEQ